MNKQDEALKKAADVVKGVFIFVALVVVVAFVAIANIGESMFFIKNGL